MDTDPNQHASSACGGLTIKEEPVEPEPYMSPHQETEFISVKEETPAETEPHFLPKQEIEYISVKGETPCLQEWEQPEVHDGGADPLTINAEECSPPDDFIGPSTSNIIKTESEEDEEEEEQAAMTVDRQDLKHEMESTSFGGEPESPIPAGLKDDSDTNDSGTNDAHGLFNKQEEFRGNEGCIELHRCDACKKTFTEYQDLKKHKEVESRQCLHYCNVCHKTFTRSHSLKRHLAVHTGERVYRCNICNKTFSQSSHLSKHCMSHTHDKPYKCAICHKTYKTKFSLNEHTIVHAGGSPSTCNECGKTFRTKKHLKSHLTVHNDLRPYSCEICNKTYKYYSSLKFHLQNKLCQRISEKAAT